MTPIKFQRISCFRTQQKANGESNPGFSLVEVMVASVILIASVSIAVTLFNFTNRNATLGENKQDQQSAISEDLAAVLKLNEQYRCTSATSCSSGESYPNENEYTSDGKDDLDSICAKTPDSGFAPLLVEAVNDLDPTPQINELNLSRRATIATNNPSNGPRHLYSVEWKNSAGISLRQVTLIPKIASWCP